jgi:hypothetical protein
MPASHDANRDAHFIPSRDKEATDGTLTVKIFFEHVSFPMLRRQSGFFIFR